MPVCLITFKGCWIGSYKWSSAEAKDPEPDDTEASWDLYLGGNEGGAGAFGLGGNTGWDSGTTETIVSDVNAGPGIGTMEVGVINGAAGRNSARGTTKGSGSFGPFVRLKNARTKVTAP